jgi:signal peptidase I
MSRRTGIRTTAAGLALAAVACLWIAFAPTQLGGRSSYALIVGTSMEPELHRGDLAIVRRHDAYRVGDVILFRDHSLGRDVLHRVVARDGSRFVTKGDNNDFRDDFKPTLDDVHGTLWLHAPAVGRPLTWLRVPSHAGLLVGLTALAALLLGSGAAAQGRRRRRLPARGLGGGFELSHETVLVGALVAAGALAFVAFLSWTRPTTRPVARQAYEQQAELSYHAPAARSAVYPDGSADTGEPVFVRLAHELVVSFDWRLASELPHGAAGVAALDAVLSDGHGWERRLPLAGPRSFADGRVRLAGRLDLDRLQATIDRVDDLTGAGIATWSLALRPHVVAHGTIAGDGVDLAFDAPVPFTLDGVRLQPDQGDSGTLQFTQRLSGTVTEPVAAPFALGVGVGTVRFLSLLGLVLAFGVAAWARSAGGGAPPLTGHDLVKARLGDLLVEAAQSVLPSGRAIELDDLEGFVRIAEAAGRLVLHTRTPHGHEYVVDDGATTYRFRIGLRVGPDAVLPTAVGQ